jgi:hypothetical protein
MLRIISIGAGVQSTTMALMAAHGEIGPMPDCAIFADTQSEPKKVYEHLSWLMSPNVLPFPVHIVTRGSLRQEILDASAGIKGAWGRPPFFLANSDGTTGMTRRQCTGDYKLDPIHKKVRELLGLKPRARSPKKQIAERWIGISLDEAIRMKPAKYAYERNRWPLVEKEMNRWDCLAWLSRNGYPQPPKSACTFCPYHSDAMWRDMKDNDPESWTDACAVDAALRSGKHIMLKGEPYLHRSLRSLPEVDLSTPEDHGQLNLFNNECEGMCGV